MYRIKKIVLGFILCAVLCSLCACGETSKNDDYASIYGKTIGGLKDDELFAIVETNAAYPVLLVTSQVYDDGLGNQASLECDVYYMIDGEVKKIGVIESLGTAYPISYDATGFYVASGHDMQCFEIEEEAGTITLQEGVYEQFDENGNATYTMIKGEQTEIITEEKYYAAFEKYSHATVVSFSYGASGAM
jgi:hypothetical protein